MSIKKRLFTDFSILFLTSLDELDILTETKEKFMTQVLDVMEQNNKFIVTKNGQPITLPKNSTSSMVAEFDSKEDAQKYISILISLKKQSKYRGN